MNGNQSIAYLTQLGTGYTPLAANLSPTGGSATQGLPFLSGGGTQAKLLNAFVSPYFNQMLSRSGMTGFGVGHDQNLYDRMLGNQANAVIASQVKQASELDRSSYMQTMQGMAALAGVSFGGQQRLAANRLADLAVTYAPTFAQTDPDLLDKLSGSRGSAAVLAQRLANTNRYRLDPVTGRMGVDPASTQNLTKNIMQDFYSDSNIAGMQGITAGQLGGLYEQLSLRGMVAGAEFGHRGMVRNLMGAVPREQLLQKAQALGIKGVKEKDGKLDLSDVSPKDLDVLTKDDAIAQKLRDFDANRVKASLKSYVGAISAMRDIFGDAGQPNAPIPELMRALEGLSTGAMGQVDPKRLGQMVRQTYYLAKSAGISADSAAMMQQDAATRGQQLGIEAPFAMLATQNSLAYNAALRSRGVMATPVFGGMTESQLTQMNSSLMQQGVASSFGTRLGTLLRIQNLLGTDATKNKDIGNVLEAVKANQKTATLADGRTITIANLTNKDVEDLAAGAGIERGTAQSMLRQTRTAREALFNNQDAANYIREVAQPQEVTQKLGSSTGATLQSFARRIGINDRNVIKQLGDVSNKLITDLMASPDAVTADTATRTQTIADMLEKSLPQEVKDRMFAGKSADERRAALVGLASNVSGNLDVVAQKSTRAGTFADLRRIMDPGLLAEGSSRQLSESMRNQAREALSGITSGSMLRNAIDALKGTNITDPAAFQKVIGQTFGGVSNRKITDALRDPMEKVLKAQKELEDMEAKISAAPPQERKAMLETYTTKAKELTGLASELRKVGETVGAYSATGLTQMDVKNAQVSAKAAMRAQRNIAVAQADDTQVTKDEIAEEMKELKRFFAEEKPDQQVVVTEQMARDAIVGRRRKTRKITNKDIETLMAEQDITKEEATDVLQSEVAAERIGVSNVAINAKINAKFDKGAKEKAITDLMQSKNISRDVATKTFEREQRQNAIYEIIEDRKDKPEVLAKKMANFEKSKDAASYREAVQAATSEQQNLINRAFDPATMRLMGIGMAGEARELQTILQERQNLVEREAGGSESKFMVNATPELKAKYNELSQKAAAVQERMAQAFVEEGPASVRTEAQREKEALQTMGLTSKTQLNTPELKQLFAGHVADFAEMDKANVDIKRQAGREREALRMMGRTSKDKLSDADKQLFERNVSDLAAIENLTEDDVKLIQTYGFRTDPATNKLVDASKTALSGLAKKLNVNVEDLSRIYQKDKDIKAELTAEKELFAATPQALATRLKTSFGLDEQAEKALTSTLGSFGARQRAATLIGTQERLETLASKGGVSTVESIKADYDKAVAQQDSAFTMDTFKEKYKLTDVRDFDRAVADIGTYNAAGLNKFKEEGGGKKLMESLKIHDDSVIRSGTTGPSEMNIHGMLSGNFTITEGKMISQGDCTMNARSSATA